ncbi:MAG: CYTH domain-containing protein [Mangrovibacterium sp.]
MGVEIERKFRLKEDFIPNSFEQIKITQGYLSSGIHNTIRIRLANEQAFLTVKGKTTGISRLEFEYEIPFEEGKQLLMLAEDALISKVRHIYQYEGKKWEVDVFLGDNDGLRIAECELLSEDELIKIPDWIDQEISDDARYHNSYLAKNPYKTWNNQ